MLGNHISPRALELAKHEVGMIFQPGIRTHHSSTHSSTDLTNNRWSGYIRVMQSCIQLFAQCFCMFLLDTKMPLQDDAGSCRICIFTMVVSDLVAFANDLTVLSLQNSGISWFPVAFACFSLCFPGGSLAILWCHHLGVLRVDLDFINVYPSVARPERASPVHAAGLLPRHVAGCGMKSTFYVPSHFHP